MEAQAGHAVTIYVRQDDGSYKLDAEALRKILNQDGVRDYPVMVVSVAGAMREGKSFLLNLFIKYLKSGLEDKWLTDNSTLEGFSWRGGAERDTLGILMWSEPYHVEDESGEKVAVLLMDTQGAFDNEHTTAQSTRIITMSLMMSSLQIYNVMQSLRADKLDFFALFLEHAKMVKHETKEKVFQSLMFLVRDWPHQDDHDFGLDGGTAHVRKQMQRFSGKIKKKDFKEIFGSVEGFLLPYPGAKVAEQRTGHKPFKGEISDMDSEFSKYVGRLARLLFRRNKIIKKTIAGAELKGYELAAFAENIAKLLENKEMPEPKDLVDAQIQAHSSNILDEFTRKFHDKMNQFVPPDQFVDDGALEMEGAKVLNNTMEEFEKRLIYGGEEAKADCRKRLDASLNHALEQLKIRNRDTRNKFRKKYEDFLTAEGEETETRLTQVFDKRCVLEEEIVKACQESAVKMKKNLQERNFGIRQFDEEFEAKIETLEKKLCNSFKAKNLSELNVAKSTCGAKETELAHEARTMLVKELGEKICSTKLELNDVVDRMKTRVLKKFDEEIDYPSFVFQVYRKSLEEKLDEFYKLADEQNAENKDKFSKDKSWELSEICKKYNEEMGRRIGKAGHDKEILEEFHKECFEIARARLEQRDIPAALKRACMEQVDQTLTRDFDKLKNRNDEHTDSYNTSCGLQKSTCLDIARERIKEKCSDRVLVEDEISAIHAEAKHDAMELFQKQCERGPKNIYQKYEAEVTLELDKLLSIAKRTNKDFENYFMLTKTTHIKEAKKNYKKAMLQKTGADDPVGEEELKAYHKAISTQTVKAFMVDLGKLPQAVQVECKKKLEDALKQTFNDILREDQKKKTECDLKAKQIIAECLEVYNFVMDEAGKGRILEEDELQSNHKSAKGKAIDKLKQLELTANAPTVKSIGDMEPMIEERCLHFREDNERRKVWAENQLLDRMEKLENVYKDEIKHLSVGRACSEDDLHHHHRAALRRAEDKAQNIGAGEIRQLCIEQIETYANSWLENTKKENNDKKNVFDGECTKAQNSALKVYKDDISRRGVLLTDRDVEDAHDRAQRSALEHFSRSGVKGPQETIMVYEQNLKSDIEDEFVSFKARNDSNLKEQEATAEKFVKSGKSEYEREMGKLVGSQTMSDAALTNCHLKAVDSIFSGFSSLNVPRTLKEDAKRRLKSGINTSYEQYQSTYQTRKDKQAQDMRNYIESDCVRAYENTMKSLCAGKTDKTVANASHVRAQQCAMEKLKAYSKPWSHERESEYTKRLDELCTQSKNGFIAEIKGRKMDLDREGAKLLSKAKQQYQSAMSKKVGGLALDESTLRQRHQLAMNEVQTFITKDSGDCQVKDAALRDFEHAMSEDYRNFRSNNEARLGNAKEKAARNLQKVREEYCSIMKTYINSVCCHGLESKHKKLKGELQGKYASVDGVDESNQIYIDYKDDRDHLLDTLMKQFIAENGNKQNLREQSYSNLVGAVYGQYATASYTQLKESHGKKWRVDGKISNFEKHHYNIKSNYIGVFRRSMPPNGCPKCEICTGSYAGKLASKIEDYKDSMIAKLEKKRWFK